jgi:hypothetical protein
MRQEQTDTWPLIDMLIRMQGCLKGSMVEHGNYGFENFRSRNQIAYDLGFQSATEMLNDLGIPKLTLAMEVKAAEAYEKCLELSALIRDLSPVMQKEAKQMRDDIELGELVYFGDIVANPKPDWLKE